MQSLSFERLAGMNCHYIRHSFSFFLNSMREIGLRNIEIWGASPHYFAEYFDNAMVKDIKKQVAAHGLKVICMTPEQVTYPINIAAQEDSLRELSVKNHLKTLEHTAILECNLMLLTPGYGNLDEPREEAWKRSADSIARIVRRAEELGITIALEHLSPISSNLINTAAQLKKMLDEVKSPNLKVTMDVVQVGIVGETVEEYFKVLGKDIVHIHFIDGTPGGHLSLGDGSLPLEKNLIDISKNDYRGFLSMEIADRRYFFDPKKADEKSIEHYMRWINDMRKLSQNS